MKGGETVELGGGDSRAGADDVTLGAFCDSAFDCPAPRGRALAACFVAALEESAGASTLITVCLLLLSRKLGHPQNCLPARGPFVAVRRSSSEPHPSHCGLVMPMPFR
jgi:hypothetical protein